MADIQANIGIGVDTTQALAAIRQLQREISVFHTLMAKGGANAAAKSLAMQQGLINTINETGKFSASMTRISSSTESFTNALEKNKLSMGQYFRYAGGASKTFGKAFAREFDTINRVATERVKDLQTQYISMGRDANGALQAIKVRPLALDMDNLGTKVMLASQKQQIFNQLLKQGTTNLLNFGKNTQWAGRQLMVGFTIPLTIFGATAAREFQKLEEQAVKFRRVYGDMFTTEADTEKALKNVRELAEEFTKYGIAVEKTIGLAAKVAQMGNVGTDLTEQVTQATKLAVLGGMEQEEALDTTISLTNAFGIAAEDLAGKIAFLNAAENQTILSIQDFNEAIPKAGSVVQQLGGSVEDLAFFLTAMREGGINASQGANALKTSLARLVAPTEVAKKEMAGFGIDIVGIVENNAGNLRNTVMALGAELNKLDPLNRARAIEQLFGKFQFARMSTMFQNISREGSQAAKVLQLTTATTEELAIVAERELKRVEESPAFRLQKQMEQLRAALAPIGEEFIKAVGPLIEFGTKLLKSFNNLGDGSKQFIVVLTAIAGVIAPAALMAFGLIANGIANLIKFFTFLGGAFGMLSGKSTLLGGQTEYMTQQQIEAAAVAASLGQSHSNLTQIFTAEATAIQSLVAQYRAAIVEQRRLSVGQTARGVAGRSPRGAYPRGFAKGGIIRGPGTGTSDSIFAMLSDGEAVIPAEMVKKYGGVVEQIISDNVPGYANSNADELALSTAKSVTGNENPRSSIVNIMKEQIQRRAERLGESLEDAAKNVQAAFGGLSDAAKKSSEALRKTTQYAEHREEVFAGQKQQAHLGPSGKTVSSTAAAATSPGKAPLQAMAKLESVTGKTYGVEEKHSWVKSMGSISNQQMGVGIDEIPEMVAKGTQVGRSGDKLIKEFKDQTVDERADSYAEGVTAAGGDINDPETRAKLVEYDQRIQQLLAERLEENANLLVLDTQEQIDALPDDMKGDYVSMEELEAQAAKDVLGGTETGKLRDVALEVPREHRVSKGVRTEVGADAATAYAEGKLSLEEFEAIDRQVASKKSPQFMVADKDKKRIREGLDSSEVDTSEATEIGQNFVDSTANAMNNAAEASSPAKRFIRIGENIVDSTAMGMEKAGEEQAKAPLPGNLEAPKPPVTPEVPQSRAGKLFSGLKSKAGAIGNKAMDAALETGPGRKVANYFAETSGADITNSQGKVVSTLHQEIKELGEASDRAADQVKENTDAVKENGQASSKGGKSDIARDNAGNPIIGPDGKPLTNKQVKNEAKKQGRQRRAGVAAGIMGTATMAVGMATQVDAEVFGFNIGEMAQKIMPVVGALAILGPMLLAMSGPVALVVAALVGIGAAYMAYQAKLKEVTESARELAESLGSGSKAMARFAEAAGKATATEVMTERRQAGTIGTALGKSEFGESFVASEEGKKYIDEIKKGFEELGQDETVAKVRQQLATAVYSGIFTVEQANGVAVEVMRALDQLGIGIDVAGDLVALFGPDGENILTNPLKIAFELLQTGSEEIETSIANLIDKTLNPDKMTSIWDIFNDEEAAARLAGDLVAFAGQRQEILDAQQLAAETEAERLRQEGRNALAAGDEAEADKYFREADRVMEKFAEDRKESLEEAAAAANTFVNQAEALQQTMQRIEDTELPNFRNFGYNEEQLETIKMILSSLEEVTGIDVGEIDDMNADQLIEAYKDNETAIKGLDTVYKNFNFTLDQMGQLVKDRFEDNETLSAQVDALIDSETSSLRFKTSILQGLAAGTLNPTDVENFLTRFSTDVKTISDEAEAEWRKNFRPTSARQADLLDDALEADPDYIKKKIAENNQIIQDAYADVDLSLGSGASQVLLDTIDKVGTEAGGALSIEVQSLIDKGDLAAAEEMLYVFQDLASIDAEGFDPSFTVDFYLNNPEKFEEYKTAIEEFEDLVGEDEDKKVTYQQVVDRQIITSGVAMDILKADQAYFESLDPFQQSVYMRALLRVEETFTAEDFEAWKAKNPWVNFAGISQDVQLQMAMTAAVKDLTNLPAFTPPVEETTPPPPGGSGAEPQIDSLLRKLRDLRKGTIEMKKGWEGLQQVLASTFASGAISQFNGLEKQIRNLGVGEGLIAQIVGMDPDEYEKRKNELFEFDNAGNIVKAKAALTNMNEAFNAVAIGEYVNGQERFIQKTKDQISAISILTANGMSLADAYETVQDAALAAAIAQGASTEEIKEILRITALVKEQEEALEAEREKSRISESVRKTNEEFRNQVAVLKELSREQGKYTDAQIQALMSDQDLQKLMLDPTIDDGALQEALRNAEQKANLEVQINLLTKTGQETEFDKYLAEVNDYFTKEENLINVNFEIATADENKLVEDAQNQIAAIQYKLDDYNAELEQISWIEEDINEKYDKRSEALDTIADANEKIANQQKAQLDIADALSKGDIAAAARAIQELRNQEAQQAQETQKDQLERAREAELKAIVGPSGRTREQLEEEIKQLERQVFLIEEQTLEPAQERIRLAEMSRDIAMDQLRLNELTRIEFEQIAAATKQSAINMEDMIKSSEKLSALAEFIQTGTKSDNWEELFPMPKAAAPPPSGGGGGGGGGQTSKGGWHNPNTGNTIEEDAKNAGYGSWQEYYNEHRSGIDPVARPTKADGGLIKMAMGGKVNRYAAGGMIVPKRMAMGGLSMGSDIVPALLTPGEFVVRRPAVSAFGVDKLEKINRGTYNDGSVYNYNLAVNVKSDADPNRIARTVITNIKSIENQRIRGNKL